MWQKPGRNPKFPSQEYPLRPLTAVLEVSNHPGAVAKMGDGVLQLPIVLGMSFLLISPFFHQQVGKIKELNGFFREDKWQLIGHWIQITLGILMEQWVCFGFCWVLFSWKNEWKSSWIKDLFINQAAERTLIGHSHLDLFHII